MGADRYVLRFLLIYIRWVMPVACSHLEISNGAWHVVCVVWFCCRSTGAHRPWDEPAEPDRKDHSPEDLQQSVSAR